MYLETTKKVFLRSWRSYLLELLYLIFPFQTAIKEFDNGALKQQHLNQQNVNGMDWSV